MPKHKPRRRQVPPEGEGPHVARPGEERFYLLWLAAITAVVAALTAAFVVDLNHNFLTSAADTSIFHNTIVNLLHGHGFRVTAYSGPNLLGQHTMFVLLLVVPIYALFPSVDTLFTLQVWVVYSAVIPLYLISRKILGKAPVAFVVAMLGLTSPLLFQMAAAPFHPESGILPAVLWSYYFYQRNHAAGFWIAFALAVSCAEQAGLIYIALGVALLGANDGLAWRQRYAKFALIGGVAWLIFAVGLLIPAMYRPGQLNVMRYHYAQWDVQSTGQLLVAVAKDPLKAIEYLLSPGRWLYLLELVGLPLGLAFLFPRSLILLAPFPLYFLLDDKEFFLNFHAYYFQFAFFAGYLGLLFFLVRPGVAWRGKAILLAAAAANLLAIYPMAGSFARLAQGRDEAWNATLRAEFATIPRDAAVYSPTRFSAYLSNRPNIVIGDLAEENLDFKAKLDQEADFTGVPPEKIDYIVCDILNAQCGWRLHDIDPAISKNRTANIDRYVASGQWQVFWNQNNVVILRRPGK
jgi:uncharacterized membrane protein